MSEKANPNIFKREVINTLEFYNKKVDIPVSIGTGLLGIGLIALGSPAGAPLLTGAALSVVANPFMGKALENWKKH